MTEQPSTASADSEPSFEVQLARTKALEPDFLGLDVAEAKLLATQLGVHLRVIDSENQPVTADLRSNRITVDARTGVITEATAG
jgi:hypothetical protein